MNAVDLLCNFHDVPDSFPRPSITDDTFCRMTHNWRTAYNDQFFIALASYANRLGHTALFMYAVRKNSLLNFIINDYVELLAPNKDLDHVDGNIQKYYYDNILGHDSIELILCIRAYLMFRFPQLGTATVIKNVYESIKDFFKAQKAFGAEHSYTRNEFSKAQRALVKEEEMFHALVHPTIMTTLKETMKEENYNGF